MEKQTKKVAIYARVSTQDQDCQRQLRDLREYAGKAGYEIVATFEEKASGMKNDRQERAKVLKLAQARKIDAILVTELSRFSRSTTDLIANLQDLYARGVSVVASTGMQMDLSTPQGKLIVTVLAGIGEFERELICERVKSGLASAKARGKKLGRAEGGNYKSGRKEGAIIEAMRAGQSCREIAKATGLGKTTVARVMAENRGELVS